MAVTHNIIVHDIAAYRGPLLVNFLSTIGTWYSGFITVLLSIIVVAGLITVLWSIIAVFV